MGTNAVQQVLHELPINTVIFLETHFKWLFDVDIYVFKNNKVY